MFTTIAYSQSQAPASVEKPIDGAPDQHIKVVGDGIYVGEFNHIIGAMACLGTSVTHAFLVSPSLRRVNPFQIRPIDIALYPDGELHHCVSSRLAIPLEINEALEAWFYSTAVGAEQGTVIVWLAPGAVTPVQGKMYTVRFSCVIASTAGLWYFSEIDFIDELPVGNYDVVGASLVCDTAVAFRFVPVGAYYRPGAPASKDVEFSDNLAFRFGALGTWFTFNTVQAPGIEVISSADIGSATFQGYMDVIPR